MRAGECWIFDTWTEHNVINDHALPRIHLVADTVGGAGFFEHLRGSRPHDRRPPGWQPRHCAPVANYVPSLDCEAENYPQVMTPWEVRAALPVPARRSRRAPAAVRGAAADLRLRPPLAGPLGPFRRVPRAWPRYRAAIEAVRQDLKVCGADQVVLRNGVGLMDALNAWIFTPALPGSSHRARCAASTPRPVPTLIDDGDADRDRAHGIGPGVRPSRVHRRLAAFRIHAALRDAGPGAERLHDRR